MELHKYGYELFDGGHEQKLLDNSVAEGKLFSVNVGESVEVEYPVDVSYTTMSGDGVVKIGRKTTEITNNPRRYFTIPPNTKHKITNTGEKLLVMLACVPKQEAA
jgi:mannose-6-phosphate isomerase-like protein (cupin superfamily)